MQTVQYIQPQHAAQLSQAELVVIDEAAAIPLPVVKTLLGPYLVFLCSTVNGYEGTGRSLSLKLIEQLRTEVSHSVSLMTHHCRCGSRLYLEAVRCSYWSFDTQHESLLLQWQVYITCGCAHMEACLMQHQLLSFLVCCVLHKGVQREWCTYRVLN